MMTRNHRMLLAAGLVTALFLLIALLASRKRDTSPASIHTSVVNRSGQLPHTSPAPDISDVPPVGSARDVPAPVIDAIRVEKQEVCAGEENLVTIEAHSPDGDDSFLHASVAGIMGMKVPIRIMPNPDGTYQMPRIGVFGRENVMTEAEVPAFKVKPCAPFRTLVVAASLMPNAPNRFEVWVRLIEVSNEGPRASRHFQPVRYHWDFGDGHREVSNAARIEHEFAVKDRTLYPSSLISVDAFNSAGEKVNGRYSLTLLNTEYQNLKERGIVTLLATGAPRYPELDAAGVVRQTFRLRHAHSGTVRITKVTKVRHFRARSALAPPPEDDVEETKELPLGSVPDQAGTVIPVTLNTEAEPELVAVTYRVDGITEDGLPARGSFSIMRPPGLPTKENSIPVRDPLLLAKVLKARELLHKPYVTQEELFRLEREGKLDGLPPLAGAEPEPHREPPRTDVRVPGS
jgi:hypothetical protein